MFKARELSIIILVTIILALTVSFLKSVNAFVYALIAIFIVIMANVLTKKIFAYLLDSEIEVGIWEVRQYGFSPSNHFKKPMPAGAILPVVISAITLGFFYWMASLVFDVRAKIYRAAKRHGLYRFSEMTEWHLGLIAASGIAINLILAVIGYFAGFSDFARFNIFYAFFNILPFSNLDGNKVFFGNVVMWSFLAALTLVGLAFAFLVI